MARRRADPDEIRRNGRVIAVQAIGAVPEGTRGTVKVVDGLTWLRYWVRWETGAWTGAVTADQIVPADRYDDYLARGAAAEAVAASDAGGGASGDAGGAKGADGPNTSAAEASTPAGEAGRIPAHLLERSQAAKARKAAAG